MIVTQRYVQWLWKGSAFQLFPRKIFSVESESTLLYVDEHCRNKTTFDWAILVSKMTERFSSRRWLSNSHLEDNWAILVSMTESHSSNALKYRNKCLRWHLTSLYRHQDQFQHTPNRSNARKLFKPHSHQRLKGCELSLLASVNDKTLFAMTKM